MQAKHALAVFFISPMLHLAKVRSFCGRLIYRLQASMLHTAAWETQMTSSTWSTLCTRPTLGYLSTLCRRTSARIHGALSITTESLATSMQTRERGSTNFGEPQVRRTLPPLPCTGGCKRVNRIGGEVHLTKLYLNFCGIRRRRV